MKRNAVDLVRVGERSSCLLGGSLAEVEQLDAEVFGAGSEDGVSRVEVETSNFL